MVGRAAGQVKQLKTLIILARQSASGWHQKQEPAERDDDRQRAGSAASPSLVGVVLGWGEGPLLPDQLHQARCPRGSVALLSMGSWFHG